ncbi:DUF502 domain-containing protein [Halolamina sp.]|jgi:uncharacterized membrane protein|uniref:DUF502 domain-containing protein n=1 Tax=Halolamina sp. TaxID=1940283 RepID=UPI00356A6652
MKLTGALKSSFVAGLILITPLAVTLYVLRLVVNWSLQFVNPVVQSTRLTQYTGNIEAVAQVVAAVSIVVSITLLGYLAQKSVGQQLFGSVGRVVNVVPLVSIIYGSVRQVANSLVERKTNYDGVVLVEYPRDGLYSIGLVTGESPQAVVEYTGQPVYNVFLPNSPNPTGGRLVLLPEDEVHELDMSVRQGMRLIVTTGMNDEQPPTAAVDALPDGATADYFDNSRR